MSFDRLRDRETSPSCCGRQDSARRDEASREEEINFLTTKANSGEHEFGHFSISASISRSIVSSQTSSSRSSRAR